MKMGRMFGIVCIGISCLAMMRPALVWAEKSAPSSILVTKTFEWDYDEDTGETFGTGEFQTAGLSAKDEEAFPALAAALRQDGDALREALTAEYEEACSNSRSERNEYQHEYEAAVETKILPRRSDAQVVSYLIFQYSYTGGAHGYYFYTGYTYDTVTGEKLSLEQIVADPQLFTQVIREKLDDKYPGQVDYDMGDPFEDYTLSGGTYEYSFCLDPDGVRVLFNPYEIAAYASGVLTVKIGFDEYEGLFTDAVSGQESPYIMEMFEWMADEVDLNGDGKLDPVIVSHGATEQSNWELEELTVQAAEASCSLSDRMISDALPLLVYAGDGKYYVYVDLTEENDYHCIEVFDLDNGSPRWAGTVEAGIGMVWDVQQEAAAISLPLSPESFLLDSRMYILSTYTGQRRYTVGADGMARPLEDDYTVTFARSLKTVRELPGTKLDPQTMQPLQEEVLVPAGEEVTICRTNGEDFVDFQCEDGSFMRVYVDQSVWPHTISGEDEASYFEMLYYAG